jgi:chromosomal replication initiation ATPase DnaA
MKISRSFGRRDHTTIMNSINNIENKRKIEPMLNQQISDLIREFKKI